MATTVPAIPPQYHDDNGDPAAGYQLFVYDAGTTTKVTTYTDSAATVPNANPIILDSAGRCTLFLVPGAYKFVLAPPTDTDPPTSPVWTRDNIQAVPSLAANIEVPGTAGEALAVNDAVYLSDGSGSLVAGRWYKTDADFEYAANTAKQVGFASSVAAAPGDPVTVVTQGIVAGFSGLTIGDIYYASATAGTITNSRPTNARALGTADTASSLILSPVEGGGQTAGPLPAIDGNELLGTANNEASKVTDTGTVGTGEDTLFSHTLAAGRLGNDGDRIKLIAWGIYANNSNAKQVAVRVVEGANNNKIFDTTLEIDEEGGFALGAIIVRSAAATYRSATQLVAGPATQQVTKSAGQSVKDFAATWANAVEVRVTGEATTDNDIVVEAATVEVVRA